MKKRIDQAPRRAPQTQRPVKKGLILLHTGSGKGKSTAAFGTAVRAMGRGYRVAIVQFIKGKWKTGEVAFFKKHSTLCQIDVMGEGFTWNTKNYDQDVKTAQRAWATCLTVLNDPTFELVIFDEILYAIQYQFLDENEVLEALQNKPLLKHVILTGGKASRAMVRLADLVTEMTCIKHPFSQGIPAQPGIEY